MKPIRQTFLFSLDAWRWPCWDSPRHHAGPCRSTNLTWKAEASVRGNLRQQCLSSRTTNPRRQCRRGGSGGAASRAGQQRLVCSPRVTPKARPRLQTRRRLQPVRRLTRRKLGFTPRRRRGLRRPIAARSISAARSKHRLGIARTPRLTLRAARQGPTFARPGDIPAIGGIPLRDRRAAFIFRNSFRADPDGRGWFIRPGRLGLHPRLPDRPAAITPPKRPCYYENYVDRQEVSGGLDVGYEAGKTFLVAGYRYGQQDQFTGPNAANTAFTDSPYDSTYHRILFGMEGSPARWLKLTSWPTGIPPIRCGHAGRLDGTGRCCTRTPP